MSGDLVWITHPGLTPAHDVKVPRSSLGVKVRQGWVERDDQSDPVDDVPADPRPPRPDVPVVDEPADPRTPRPVPAADPAVDVSPESPALSGTSKPSPAPRKES